MYESIKLEGNRWMCVCVCESVLNTHFNSALSTCVSAYVLLIVTDKAMEYEAVLVVNQLAFI